ncbi:hypothetical protein P7K49_016844, partial [Saguinus oedipus]
MALPRELILSPKKRFPFALKMDSAAKTHPTLAHRPPPLLANTQAPLLITTTQR